VPDWLNIVLLGIIEGVTEFLPISSTGHLLIAEHWMSRQTELFNIVIQSGAVVAVALAFPERWRQLIAGWRERAAWDYFLKLGAAFAVTGVGGLVLEKRGIGLPEALAPVAWAMVVGGVLFLWVERGAATTGGSDQISWGLAFGMGLAQLVAAVFPGASRSGATILLALAAGVERRAATEFAFLLGVPTLLAAGGLKLFVAWRDGVPAGFRWDWVLLGTVVSAVVAFASVKWLLRYLQTHTFVGFGWYRIVVGGALLVMSYWR
jgi:undecaprenyl-diphosphatase